MKKIKILFLISFILTSYKVIADDVYFYGKISYYGDEFVGRKTSSGAIFDNQKYTCASKSLPFGTILEVMNVKNGKSVVLMVNDRGPFVEGRILDVTKKAAQDLDMINDGITFARIRIVKLGNGTFSESEYQKMIGEYYQVSAMRVYEFAVQVGAFTNKTRALNVLNKLKSDGFNNAYITEKYSEGMLFNRVRVGDYGDKETAMKVMEQLKNLGYDTYFVSTYVEKQ
jgi:rare lipoprotein A